MGIVMAAMVILLWILGILEGTLNQLPAWPHDMLVFTLGLIGLKDPPGDIPLILLLLLLYWVIYFIKPARLFIGEKFANIFFGVANVFIVAGELCLEHRWTSLFIVIGLAGFITWGAYYLFETTRRHDMLVSNFGHWLDQVDNFSNRSTVSLSESEGYKQVDALWNEDYQKVIELPNMRPHPAFTLHNLLEELYPEEPLEKSWHDFLREKLPQLTKYMKEFQPRASEFTPTEKRAWALMNILLGRVYVRLSDKCDPKNGCPELLEAKKYFSALSTGQKVTKSNEIKTLG
jgi:hypothetical protein